MSNKIPQDLSSKILVVSSSFSNVIHFSKTIHLKKTIEILLGERFMSNNYFEPKIDSDAFTCPNCGVYAKQNWYILHKKRTETHMILDHLKKLEDDEVMRKASTRVDLQTSSLYDPMEDLHIAICDQCYDYSLWKKTNMIYPIGRGPLPNPDMPPEIQYDFLEARTIIDLSPRGSAALLRLALQKLMPHFGEKGNNINDDIKILVTKGLDIQIQEAMDALRVVGGESVHPGTLDMKDDTSTALALSELTNIIIHEMISKRKEIKRVYDILPKEKLDAIKKRDKKVH